MRRFGACLQGCLLAWRQDESGMTYADLVSHNFGPRSGFREADSIAFVMKDILRGLLYRICSYGVGAWHMPRGVAASVYPPLRQPTDPKRANLPIRLAPFPPVANFMSLPDPLLEQILQVLPTKDR